MVEPISTEDARRETRLMVKTFAALMGLLALTLLIATVDLGWGNVVANLSIATLKAGLVLWIFMHLREMGPLLRLFAVGAVFWVGILLIIGMGDWMTRGGPPG